MFLSGHPGSALTVLIACAEVISPVWLFFLNKPDSDRDKLDYLDYVVSTLDACHLLAPASAPFVGFPQACLPPYAPGEKQLNCGLLGSYSQGLESFLPQNSAW